MLEQTIRRYQNRAIEAAQVIEELIQLAQDMREANARGEVLGLSEDELALVRVHTYEVWRKCTTLPGFVAGRIAQCR